MFTPEVLNTTFSDALATYYELMSKSPNLSEEVLREIHDWLNAKEERVFEMNAR